MLTFVVVFLLNEFSTAVAATVYDGFILDFVPIDRTRMVGIAY